MQFDISIPDVSQVPVWVYIISAVMVWYPLAGWIIKRYDDSPSENLGIAWIISPIWLPVFIFEKVASKVVKRLSPLWYVLSGGLLSHKPPVSEKATTSPENIAAGTLHRKTIEQFNEITALHQTIARLRSDVEHWHETAAHREGRCNGLQGKVATFTTANQSQRDYILDLEKRCRTLNDEIESWREKYLSLSQLQEKKAEPTIVEGIEIGKRYDGTPECCYDYAIPLSVNGGHVTYERYYNTGVKQDLNGCFLISEFFKWYKKETV